MPPVEKLILRKFNKAVSDYKMIVAGDRIIAAVSGGKDSLTMLEFLAQMEKRSHINFELDAIHIKTDFGRPGDDDNIKKIADRLGVRLHVVDVPVLSKVGADEKMSCYWCSNQRRRELLKFARSSGFNKIALGHHLDDIAETLLMNIMFNGKIAGMKPVIRYDRDETSIIRPLALVRESEIVRYARLRCFENVVCRCEYDSNSKRKDVRKMIRAVSAENTGVQENILRSMSNIDLLHLME